MKKRKIIGILALTTLACVSLASCDENDTNTSDNITENESNSTFEVKFNSNGGSNVVTQNVKSGNKVTRPDNPTKNSTNTTVYNFKGWYTDNTLNNEFDFNSNVNSNITLYAKWEEVAREYTIKFVDYNDNIIEETKYHYNDIIDVPDCPPKEGNYAFLRWDSVITNVISDKTYKAIYTDKRSATISNLSELSKIYDGNPIEIPTFDVDSQGTLKVEYKRYEDDDSKYSKELPSDLGKYSMRITVDETEEYEKTEYVKEFTISSQNYIVCNLSTFDKLELLLDKEGYVVSETALDEPSEYILKEESYLGLRHADAIKKHLDDLVDYEFIRPSRLSSINIDYSFNDYKNKLNKELDEYLENRYKQNTYVSISDYSKSSLENTFRDYIFLYSYNEVSNFTFDELIKGLLEIREETKDLKSIEAKRLYALNLAINIYKLRVETIKDSVKDDQMSDYGALKNSLPVVFNSTTGTINQQVDRYYNSLAGPSTSAQSARNNYVISYLGLRNAIDNKLGTEEIHKFITNTINGSSYISASMGIFSGFSMLTGGYNSFLSTYSGYENQISSLCITNNLDLDAVVNNNLDTLKENALEYARTYDYDLWSGKYIKVKYDKLYLYYNKNTAETYYITQDPQYGSKYCYIYKDVVTEENLENNKPIRYCSCYLNGNELIIQDYYRQDYIRLTIDGNNISMDNYLTEDIEYIYNDNNYGSGTTVFVKKFNDKTMDYEYKTYVYQGIHTKEEIEEKSVQYYNIGGTWEESNGHIIYTSNIGAITNLVKVDNTYLAKYEIDLEKVDLLYILSKEENGIIINYAFINDNDSNYVIRVSCYDPNTYDYIKLDYDKMLEIFLDVDSFTNGSISGLDGSVFWSLKDDVIIFDNKLYILDSNNEFKDVTNEYKDITIVRSFFTNLTEGSYLYYFVKITNYLNETRYEVRLYDFDSDLTDDDVINDIKENGFQSNHLAWQIKGDYLVILDLDPELNEGYNEYKMGQVLIVEVLENGSYQSVLLEEENITVLYSYNGGGADAYLFQYNGFNMAYKYPPGTQGFDPHEAHETVTWDYTSEGNIIIYGFNNIEDGSYIEFEINEDNTLEIIYY